MNSYKPLEKRDENGKPSGIYHMCMINDNMMLPVGYCGQNNCQHKTEIEAADCYRQYNIDIRCHIDGPETTSHSECMVENCSTITNKHADVGIGAMNHMFRLCDAHRNKEEVKKLMGFGEGLYLYASY